MEDQLGTKNGMLTSKELECHLIVVREGNCGSSQEIDDLNLMIAHLYPLRHRSGHDHESTAISREAEGSGAIFSRFCHGALMMRKIADLQDRWF